MKYNRLRRVTERKKLVEPIYICNNDFHKFLCKYYPTTGTFHEILRPSSQELDLRTGFYVNVNGVLIGVFASLDGPILFRNEEQFLLQQGRYRFDLEKKTETRIFTFIIDQIEKFSIEYERYKYIDYDPWSTEEFVDFFLWLYNCQFHDNFYDSFTLIVSD